MRSDDMSQQAMKKQEPGLCSAEITEAVTNHLINSMRPMSEVDNERFIELFARYQLPCIKTIQKKLPF